MSLEREVVISLCKHLGGVVKQNDLGMLSCEVKLDSREPFERLASVLNGSVRQDIEGKFRLSVFEKAFTCPEETSFIDLGAYVKQYPLTLVFDEEDVDSEGNAITLRLRDKEKPVLSLKARFISLDDKKWLEKGAYGVDIRWSSGAVDVHSYVVKERLLRELRKERWRRMQECLTRFFD